MPTVWTAVCDGRERSPAFFASNESRTHGEHDGRDAPLQRSFRDATPAAPIQNQSKMVSFIFMLVKRPPAKIAARLSPFRATRDGRRRPRLCLFWRRKIGRDPSASKS